MSREKEIKALQAQLAKLVAEQEREEQLRETIGAVHQALKEQLAQAGVSMEEYVRSNYKEFRRLVERIARSQGDMMAPKKKAASKKKAAAKKKRARRKKARGGRKVVVPGGTYTNVPPETDKVFHVKIKGPRPKAIQEYAEKVGLEAFLRECAVKEEE
jgi:TolA-binding protein